MPINLLRKTMAQRLAKPTIDLLDSETGLVKKQVPRPPNSDVLDRNDVEVAKRKAIESFGLSEITNSPKLIDGTDQSSDEDNEENINESQDNTPEEIDSPLKLFLQKQHETQLNALNSSKAEEIRKKEQDRISNLHKQEQQDLNDVSDEQLKKYNSNIIDNRKNFLDNTLLKFKKEDKDKLYNDINQEKLELSDEASYDKLMDLMDKYIRPNKKDAEE